LSPTWRILSFFDIFRALESDAHAHAIKWLQPTTIIKPSNWSLAPGDDWPGGWQAWRRSFSEMDSDLIEMLKNNRIPVVFYDVGTPKKNITNIRVDYRKGMKQIVEYLHVLGHRRMGSSATTSPWARSTSVVNHFWKPWRCSHPGPRSMWRPVRMDSKGAPAAARAITRLPALNPTLHVVCRVNDYFMGCQSPA